MSNTINILKFKKKIVYISINKKENRGEGITFSMFKGLGIESFMLKQSFNSLHIETTYCIMHV